MNSVNTLWSKPIKMMRRARTGESSTPPQSEKQEQTTSLHDQLLKVRLKRRQYFDTFTRQCDHIAVPQPTLAVDVDCRFNIEDHPSFQHIARLRVQPGRSVMVDSFKTNAVPQSMSELAVEAMGSHNVAGCRINLHGTHTGSNSREGCISRRKDRVIHCSLTFIGVANCERTGNVGPVSIQVGIAVNHSQVFSSEFARARKLVSGIC